MNNADRPASLALSIALGLLACPIPCRAAPTDALHACIAQQLDSAADGTTIGELRAECSSELQAHAGSADLQNVSLARERM